jgi:hypothetical protein
MRNQASDPRVTMEFAFPFSLAIAKLVASSYCVNRYVHKKITCYPTSWRSACRGRSGNVDV